MYTSVILLPSQRIDGHVGVSALGIEKSRCVQGRV